MNIQQAKNHSFSFFPLQHIYTTQPSSLIHPNPFLLQLQNPPSQAYRRRRNRLISVTIAATQTLKISLARTFLTKSKHIRAFSFHHYFRSPAILFLTIPCRKRYERSLNFSLPFFVQFSESNKHSLYSKREPLTSSVFIFIFVVHVFVRLNLRDALRLGFWN